MLGLATASIATMAGGISLAYFSPSYLSTANAESVSAPAPLSEQELVDSSETKTIEQTPAVEASTPTRAIATTYDHEISGRSATTVYVRNIPVATFLEKPQADSTNADSTNADSTNTNGTTDSADLPTKPTQGKEEPENFVDAINNIGQNKDNADKIGVKWDKTTEKYIIHIEEQPLIAMNGNVILPTTTKDVAEDALQITNRLRRQLGNVKPLKTIEGQPPRKVAVAPTNVRRYQAGWASWYGPGFHGNLTADGTRYNQYGLSAAHRTLPFGTRLRVTNQNNGRSVVVIVNDRGPFIHNRVIDLSMGAAQVLGITSTGIAPVTLDIVN